MRRPSPELNVLDLAFGIEQRWARYFETGVRVLPSPAQPAELEQRRADLEREEPGSPGFQGIWRFILKQVVSANSGAHAEERRSLSAVLLSA
jgi:hypothetical protein